MYGKCLVHHVFTIVKHVLTELKNVIKWHFVNISQDGSKVRYEITNQTNFELIFKRYYFLIIME